jgi:peptidase E
MTKYVLNSGGLRNAPEKGRRFLAEIVKDLGPSPKMLVTLFAQPREDWEEKFAQYRDELNERAPDRVKVSFELAFPDTFKEQVSRNDIVYVHGGDDHLVKYWFDKLNIPKVWKDKVVATSSAGSDVLAKHFWTCDWRQCMDGLGILPIKFLPHYKSKYGENDPRGPIDWEKAYKVLAEYGDKSLPIHALEEGDYVVVEVQD